MATVIMFSIIALLAISIILLIGNPGTTELHHTDLMAGDGGED